MWESDAQSSKQNIIYCQSDGHHKGSFLTMECGRSWSSCYEVVRLRLGSHVTTRNRPCEKRPEAFLAVQLDTGNELDCARRLYKTVRHFITFLCSLVKKNLIPSIQFRVHATQVKAVSECDRRSAIFN